MTQPHLQSAIDSFSPSHTSVEARVAEGLDDDILDALGADASD